MEREDTEVYVTYTKGSKVEAFYINFGGEEEITSAKEVDTGVVVDLDSEGFPTGLEILGGRDRPPEVRRQLIYLASQIPPKV